MSTRRDAVRMDGVLLLDKPPGLTSNAALMAVKRRFGAASAGHTGALDPLATGLLPVCLGEATKVAGLFLDADKSYVARLQLDGTRVVKEEKLLPDVGRVRDVREGPDGWIYLLTDERDGRLLRVKPGA